MPETRSEGERLPTSQAVIVAPERDAALRELEAFFLKDERWAVHFAHDGEEALRLCRALRPDLLVTDYLLPGLDGIGLCRIVKGDPSTAGAAVVVLSILTASSRAEAAGADVFLRRPLPGGKLIEAVQGLVGNVPAPFRPAAPMRSLADLTRALTTGACLEEVLELALACAVELLDGERGAVFLRDELGQLRVRAARRIGEGVAADFAEPLDETLSTRLDGLFGPGARERFVGAPVVSGDRIEGVLAVDRRRRTAAGEEEEWLLSVVADQAAVALLNARGEAERSGLEARVEELLGFRERTERALENAIHDLRAPLNAILGYLELVATGLFGPLGDRQSEALERVRGIISHVHAVVDDTLVTVRREQHGEPPPSRVPVADLVSRAVSLLAPAAKSKGLSICTDLEDGLLVECHPERLMKVLVNLLDNAVKYCPPGSTVRLAQSRVAEEPEGWCELVIADDGPGIPPDRAEDVFRPGMRLEPAGSDPGGRGLGLAISRELVEQMGGRIAVDQNDGPGTTFRIRLPAGGAGADGE